MNTSTNHIVQEAVVVAADIGGSHITAATIDIEKREIITSTFSRKPVSPFADTQALIRSWGACIMEAAGSEVIGKLCIAIPGPFHYEEGVCLIKDQNKFPGLYGANVKVLLAAVLNIAPSAIYFHNDAACFLHGEVFCGSVEGYESVIAVTLGTGLGTAVYKDGYSTSADLWSLPFNGSIAEDYLSSRWFQKRYSDITGRQITGVKELTELAGNNGDVQKIFAEFASNLAAFVLHFLRREKADAVVVGGNIAKSFPLFKEIFLEQVYHEYPSIFITPSAFGEEAALLGAAGSWHLQSGKKQIMARRVD